jgi:hypothetical protein
MPADRIAQYKTIASVASCLGLFTACGLGVRTNQPPPPPEPPPSDVSLSADSIDFAPTTIGSASAPQQISVTNHGSLPISFQVFSLNGSFVVRHHTCAVPLQPNTQCTVEVVFHPRVPRPTSSTLILRSQGSVFLKVELHGTGMDSPFNPGPSPFQSLRQ